MIEVRFLRGPLDGEVRALPDYTPYLRVPFIPEGGLPRWWEPVNVLPSVAVAHATAVYKVLAVSRIVGRRRVVTYVARIAHIDWPKPPADRCPFPRIVLFPFLGWLTRGRWA